MKRLNELQKSKGVTAEDIARATGIGAEQYAAIASGAEPPDLKTLSDLADYFCVSIDYLLERSDELTPPASPSAGAYFNPSVKIPPVLENAGLGINGGGELTQRDVDEMAAFAERLKKRKGKLKN